MGVDVTEDLLEQVKSQQASLFASETSTLIFQSRVRTMEQKETFLCSFFQKTHRESSVLSSLKEKDGSVITNQVKFPLGSVIHPDQAGTVPGTKISESLVLLRDMISYVSDRGVNACLISLNQEKAFDKIFHNNVWDLLSKMNFGERIHSQCSLSIVGDNLIIGYEVRSVLYVALVWSTPHACTTAVTRVIFRFIWTSKVDRAQGTPYAKLWKRRTLSSMVCSWDKYQLHLENHQVGERRSLVYPKLPVLQLVFQCIELTLTDSCRLAHSKVKHYMLRDTLMLRELPSRHSGERPLSKILVPKYNEG
eukprot:g41205.t1